MPSRVSNPENAVSSVQMLVFHLAGQRHALPLKAVERVFRMVEITPLTEPQPPVCGVVDYHGQIVPVIDSRELFHLEIHEAELDDELILFDGSPYPAILWVDHGVRVATVLQSHITPPENLPQQLRFASGVFCDAGGMIVLHDAARLLSCLSDWPVKLEPSINS